LALSLGVGMIGSLERFPYQKANETHYFDPLNNNSKPFTQNDQKMAIMI